MQNTYIYQYFQMHKAEQIAIQRKINRYLNEIDSWPNISFSFLSLLHRCIINRLGSTKMLLCLICIMAFFFLSGRTKMFLVRINSGCRCGPIRELSIDSNGNEWCKVNNHLPRSLAIILSSVEQQSLILTFPRLRNKAQTTAQVLYLPWIERKTESIRTFYPLCVSKQTHTHTHTSTQTHEHIRTDTYMILISL